MTKMQEKTVEKIRVYILKYDCYGNSSNYELKRFDVKQIELGLVRVYSIVGCKNDEESILRFISRTRRKIIIGPRGGVTANVFIKGKFKVFRGWTKAMLLGYDKYAHDFPSD
jgi:hypothetical protein